MKKLNITGRHQILLRKYLMIVHKDSRPLAEIPERKKLLILMSSDYNRFCLTERVTELEENVSHLHETLRTLVLKMDFTIKGSDIAAAIERMEPKGLTPHEGIVDEYHAPPSKDPEEINKV